MEIDKNYINRIAGHPLQTWEWGQFRQSWGNEVVYTKYGLLTLHKIPLLPYKLGMFIKGPGPTKQMLVDLKKLAREKKIIFIKFEPNVIKDDKLIELFGKNGAVRGKTLFTPSTFWIDLTKSEEELLKSFSSKTRYNIRLAQKRGVVVVEEKHEKAFERYIKLTRETVTRQGFYAHTEGYHRLMWKHLHQSPITNHQSPIAHLLAATYNKEVITTWIVFVWKDFLYYPYGASTEKYKEVMANNLMMWESIRFGKSLGLKTFDLWGREEGKGFTRFKEGYSPRVVEFLGTWDLVINKPVYWIYRVAEKARWLLLRLKARLGFSRNTF